MKNIYIKTEHGHMIIYADQFFPCTQKRFRKLLSVIKKFSYLNNVHELTEQLKLFIILRIKHMEPFSKDKKTKREILTLERYLEMLEQIG